jgi:hypothetical protein
VPFVLRAVFFAFAGVAVVVFAAAAFVVEAGACEVAFVSVVAGASGGSVAPWSLSQAFQPPSSGRTFVKP